MVQKYSTKMRGSLGSGIFNSENSFVYFLDDRANIEASGYDVDEFACMY